MNAIRDWLAEWWPFKWWPFGVAQYTIGSVDGTLEAIASGPEPFDIEITRDDMVVLESPQRLADHTMAMLRAQLRDAIELHADGHPEKCRAVILESGLRIAGVVRVQRHQDAPPRADDIGEARVIEDPVADDDDDEPTMKL